jgi:hypothetical protein
MDKSLNENAVFSATLVADIYSTTKKLDLMDEINQLENEIKEELANIDKLKDLGLKAKE